MKTRVVVDTVAGSGESPERVVLGIFYDENVARIDISVSESLFDREPQIDVFRRSFQELLSALKKWEAEHGQIETKDEQAHTRSEARTKAG
jgi:hypothetical protein